VHQKADGSVVFDGRDFAAFAALLNQVHRNLELFGKSTGYLRDEPVSATNVVIGHNHAVSAAPAEDEGQVLDVAAEKVSTDNAVVPAGASGWPRARASCHRAGGRVFFMFGHSSHRAQEREK
jgi:hypothetical protein